MTSLPEADYCLDLENRLLAVLTDVARLRIRMSRANSDAQPTPVTRPLPTDLIEVGIAAALARRAPDTVRNWCRTMPIDQTGGFAIKLGGRWQISRRPFLEYIRR